MGISQRRPSISRLAAVAAELGRMTSAAVTRMGPPAEPQGMALGDSVGGAGDSGEKAAKPPTANGRQCVHRPVGRRREGAAAVVHAPRPVPAPWQDGPAGQRQRSHRTGRFSGRRCRLGAYPLSASAPVVWMMTVSAW